MLNSIPAKQFSLACLAVTGATMTVTTTATAQTATDQDAKPKLFLLAAALPVTVCVLCTHVTQYATAASATRTQQTTTKAGSSRAH